MSARELHRVVPSWPRVCSLRISAFLCALCGKIFRSQTAFQSLPTNRLRRTIASLMFSRLVA
jgi:hypothetical protein